MPTIQRNTPGNIYLDREVSLATAGLFGFICQLGEKCFAKQDTLAEMLDISSSTLKRHLKVLFQQGYISKGPRTGRSRTLRVHEDAAKLSGFRRKRVTSDPPVPRDTHKCSPDIPLRDLSGGSDVTGRHERIKHDTKQKDFLKGVKGLCPKLQNLASFKTFEPHIVLASYRYAKRFNPEILEPYMLKAISKGWIPEKSVQDAKKELDRLSKLDFRDTKRRSEQPIYCEFKPEFGEAENDQLHSNPQEQPCGETARDALFVQESEIGIPSSAFQSSLVPIEKRPEKGGLVTYEKPGCEWKEQTGGEKASIKVVKQHLLEMKSRFSQDAKKELNQLAKENVQEGGQMAGMS